MTGNQLIAASLRKLNILNVGDTADAAQLATGLEALNDMLDAWSIDRLTVFTRQSATYSLIRNQASYTIGKDPSGTLTADFDAARPSRIENANLLIGGLAYELYLANDTEWASRGLRNFSAIPSMLYADGSYPLSTLSLYPAPAEAYQLELFAWQALTEFADGSTQYYFPPGYARALKANLALECAADYQLEPSASLVKVANESKAAIENLNLDSLTQQVDPALLRNRNGRTQMGWLGNYR